MRFLPYLQLFRADAAVITFSSYLFGAELAGGAHFRDLGLGLLVTLVSMNFCYTYNSWTDREADALNKPGRPIPGGRISQEEARRFSQALFILSMAYPFFVAPSFASLVLFLALPLLGWLYSSPRVRLKKRPPFSILIISGGLTIPLVLGYINISHSMERSGLFLCLLAFCASVIPLKDIGDEAGDLRAGEVNLHHRYGRRLPAFTVAGLSVVFLLALIVDEPWMIRGGTAWMALSGLAVAGGYMSRRKSPRDPYTVAIRLVEMLAVGGWLTAFLANRDLLGPWNEWVRVGMGLG